MAPVVNLVDMVDRNELELPEIQRGYVWNRPQVRDLLDSLYRGYPVGTVLVWQADAAPIARPLEAGTGQTPMDVTGFLLDGQQHLTSLTFDLPHANLPAPGEQPGHPFQPRNRRVPGS